MANGEHVALVRKGVDAWNAWRTENPCITPDLSGSGFLPANFQEMDFHGADLRKVHFTRADLSGADLSAADLSGALLFSANLYQANFRGANLSGTRLSEADLREADLRGANLRTAILRGANLGKADLRGADLSGANLRHANLVEAQLAEADLTGCHIYGISAWGLNISKDTKQISLIITDDKPEITVDNIEIAQFVHLLLYNHKIRDVIDTITSKVVLILGRFTEERKAVLDALRDELRRRDYLPILVDFDKPTSRDITETISLLARMARFVLADITDARSVPQELNVIVPDLPSVPVQPLLLEGNSEYGMFEHYTRYPWVLPLRRYETQDQLIAKIGEWVIRPAELKALELRGR